MPHKHNYWFLRSSIWRKGFYIFQCREPSCLHVRAIGKIHFWGHNA